MGIPMPITMRCRACDELLILTPPVDIAQASLDIATFTEKHYAHRSDVAIELAALAEGVPQQRTGATDRKEALPLVEH